MVEYIKIDNIVDIVNELNKKYKTIAIITKNQIDANNYFEKLKSSIDIELITSNNLNYNNNVNILPSYLSKGLEFDAVIIIDKNDFNKNSTLDLKLLYVSMTRALHKLYIIN